MNVLKISGLKLFSCFLPLSFFCCTSVRQTSNNLLSSRLPSPPPPHPPHHHLPPHIRHTIDRLLDDNLLNAQLRGEEQPGFSALITKNFEFEKHGPRKPLYNRVGGASSIESNQLISETTKFYIGSMTKQFTAVAILTLKESGHLELSDSIQEHLPDFPVKRYNGKDVPITIEQLLTHTSGLIKSDSITSDDLIKIRNIIIKNRDLSVPQAVSEYYKNELLLFQAGKSV